MDIDLIRREWEIAIAKIRQLLAEFLKALSNRPLSDHDKAWIREQMATIETLLDSYHKTFDNL